MTAEPIKTQPDGNRTTLLLYWGAIVVTFALVDFVGGALVDEVENVVLIVLFVGAAGAQIALHALWTVFAPVAPLKKFIVAIASFLIWGGVWVLGIFLGSLYFYDYNPFGYDYSGQSVGVFESLMLNWHYIAASFLTLPLLAIVSHAPLWVTRYFFRWKVVHIADPASSKTPSLLRIRHIMLATGIVAVTLSAGRLASHLFQDDEFLLIILGISLSVAGIGIFTLLPITAVILWMRRPFHGLLILFAIYMGPLVAFILLGTYYEGPPPVDFLIFSIALPATYFGLLTAFLYAVRSLGYRLQWGRGTKWNDPIEGST